MDEADAKEPPRETPSSRTQRRSTGRPTPRVGCSNRALREGNNECPSRSSPPPQTRHRLSASTGSRVWARRRSAPLFPNTLYILLEDGLPAGVQVQAVRSLSTLDGVMGVLRWLFAEAHNFQTLVVDTVDALEPIILESVCRENGWANIETPSYGKGYLLADAAWRKFLAGCDHLRRRKGITIVLLGHSTVEKVEDPRVPIYGSYALRLHKRARALVMDACDVVGFLSTDIRSVAEDKGFGQERIRAEAGGMRWLFLEGRPAFMAKNRYGMPPKIAVGPDFKIETLLQYFPKPHRAEAQTEEK